MDSEIIAALIAGAIVVLCGLVGWMWSVHASATAADLDILKRVHALETEHLAFKLAVAEKYASIPYLKDVEERLVETIEKLSELVDRLRESMTQAPQPPQSTHRRSRRGRSNPTQNPAP